MLPVLLVFTSSSTFTSCSFSACFSAFSRMAASLQCSLTLVFCQLLQCRPRWRLQPYLVGLESGDHTPVSLLRLRL